MDSFKGTSSSQDIRFGDKEKKLLRTMKFPAEMGTKVDMRKVELSVMKPWIAKKVIDLLGFEDEVVIEYVSGLLEDEANPIVDGKKMTISLLGFLEKQTQPFMSELWALLLSAQESPVKVPAIFIEQKKEEMRKRQEEKSRTSEVAIVRAANEESKTRAIDDIRTRERQERDNQRGGDRPNSRGGRENRGVGFGQGGSNNNGGRSGLRDSWEAGSSDRRRDDRDQPRRREDNSRPQRRNDDDRRDRDRRPRRSPSRSRSPPRRRRRSPSPAVAADKAPRGRDTTPKYSRSASRSISRSRSPPRRKRRSSSDSRSRSRSRSPPRKSKSDKDDRKRSERRRRSPTRSRSRSPRGDKGMRSVSKSPEKPSKEDELRARLQARKGNAD